METDALESGREVAEGNYVVFGERAFQCEYLSVSGMAAMGTRHIQHVCRCIRTSGVFYGHFEKCP